MFLEYENIRKNSCHVGDYNAMVASMAVLVNTKRHLLVCVVGEIPLLCKTYL